MSMQPTQLDTASPTNAQSHSWWWQLLRPPAGIADIRGQNVAQLLFGLCLTIFFLTPIGYVVNPGSSRPLLTLIAAAAIGVVLSRTRYFQYGAIFIVLSFSLLSLARAIADVNFLFYYLPLVFVLSSLLLTFRWVAVAILGNILATLTLPLFTSLRYFELGTVMGILSVLGLLLIFATWFRNKLEREGLKELRSANEALNTLRTDLDAQVQARTAELAVAVEVGRSLSQVGELKTVLTQAVELICERFNLYHVQIYLTDAKARTLQLQAGTGQVAKSLLSLSHNLAIDSRSINGNAALSKNSVIVADTSQNDLFRANPLLPATRSEMSVPLLVGERLLGVLDLQSSEVNGLTESSQLVFEAVASQLAIAIDNANLFTAASQAQAEVESYVRRLTREGWSNYFDAINREEKLAYVHEASKAETAVGNNALDLTAANTLEMPILVANEPIGTIQVAAEDDRDWTPETQTLVAAVARQVAQQMENLRLLDEAQQYRLEAEAAMQRITQKAWQEYQAAQSLAGFVYDGTEVSSLETDSGASQAAGKEISLPLQIHDEIIGHLALPGDSDIDEETRGLLTAVAQQLSDHIEELRLVDQTEKARANAEKRSSELALINRVMSAVTTSFDLTRNMQIIAEELAKIIDVSRVGITLVTEDQASLKIITEYPPPIPGSAEDVIGQLIPIKGNLLMEQAINTRKFAIAYDAQNSPLTASIHDLLRQREVHALGVLPMVIGDELFGTVGFDLLDPNRVMTDEQMRLAETIVYQATTVVQNARLFTQTQQALAETNEQARRLAVLNELSETISRKQTLKDIVATVIETVPKMLEADRLSLHLVDETDPTMLNVVGVAGEVADTAAGEQIPLEDTPMAEALKTQQIVTGVFDAGDHTLHAYFAPLLASGRPLGTFSMAIAGEAELKESDRQILLQIASLLSTTLENRRLFDQTSARADREQLLNNITHKIQGTMTMESALQTAVQELGKALKVKHAQAELNLPGKNSETKAAVPQVNGSNGSQKITVDRN
ncbi:GAF domain-containing protein [Candidatus Leptofilum sp.]|uniref:GAF domain-containing protein n=1 Tax=Candidatus Leptofilum sp. TaxID=3241576 RepID=UPI003B5CDBF7